MATAPPWSQGREGLTMFLKVLLKGHPAEVRTHLTPRLHFTPPFFVSPHPFWLERVELIVPLDAWNYCGFQSIQNHSGIFCQRPSIILPSIISWQGKIRELFRRLFDDFFGDFLDDFLTIFFLGRIGDSPLKLAKKSSKKSSKKSPKKLPKNRLKNRQKNDLKSADFAVSQYKLWTGMSKNESPATADAVHATATADAVHATATADAVHATAADAVHEHA